MIYVNQNAFNRYQDLDQIMNANKLINIDSNKDYIDDNDEDKNYKNLPTAVKAGAQAYKKKFDLLSHKKHNLKKLSQVGNDIISTSRSKCSCRQRLNTTNSTSSIKKKQFVYSMRKAVLSNIDPILDNEKCVRQIDQAFNITPEDLSYAFSRRVVVKKEDTNNHSNILKTDISQADTSVNNPVLSTSNMLKPEKKITNFEESKQEQARLQKEKEEKEHQTAMELIKKQQIKQKRKRVLKNAIKYIISNGVKIEDFLKDCPFPQKPFTLRNSEEFLDAVKFDNPEIVKQAVECNYKYLFEYDYFRQTAYHWAAKLGNEKILEILLNGGPACNQFDHKYRTPLYLAALNNEKNCVNLLLRYGANPALADEEGKKPEDVTTNEEIRQVLINAFDKSDDIHQSKLIN